jgi:hypothetical protein
MLTESHLNTIFGNQKLDKIIQLVPMKNHSKFNTFFSEGNYRQAILIATDIFHESTKDPNDKVKLALAKVMLEQVCKAEMGIVNSYIKKGDFESDISTLIEDMEIVVLDENHYPIKKELRISILATIVDYYLQKHTGTQEKTKALPYLVQLVEYGESQHRDTLLGIIGQFPHNTFDTDKLTKKGYVAMIRNGLSLLNEGDIRGYEYLSEGLIMQLSQNFDYQKQPYSVVKPSYIDGIISRMESWGIELTPQQKLNYQELKHHSEGMVSHHKNPDPEDSTDSNFLSKVPYRKIEIKNEYTTKYIALEEVENLKASRHYKEAKEMVITILRDQHEYEEWKDLLLDIYLTECEYHRSNNMYREALSVANEMVKSFPLQITKFQEIVVEYGDHLRGK